MQDLSKSQLVRAGLREQSEGRGGDEELPGWYQRAKSAAGDGALLPSHPGVTNGDGWLWILSFPPSMAARVPGLENNTLCADKHINDK